MKTARYSDSQIMAILKQAESGTAVPELCREHGMSKRPPFTNGEPNTAVWTVSLMARLKELEDENRRLKKMYAEERLKFELRKEALEKKW